MASKYQLRSISLPSRSHPSTIRVDEELIKLKTWEEATSSTSTPTSKSISIGFSLLQDLYLSLDAFLNMASTQNVISQIQGDGDDDEKKHVEEVLDGSMRVLDICGITRDIMLQIKENVQSLHSSLRRRKGDSSSVEKSVLEYNFFTKKMKKNAKKVITNLKHMENKFGVSPILNNLGDHFGAVVRVLREVIQMNLFVFQSLLSFLSMSKSKSKSTKWLMVAKFVHKGVIACEDNNNSQNVNELQCVEASLSTLLIEGTNNGEKMHFAHEKLEALENVLESFDNDLESTFRYLIKTRSTLLNIISQ